MIENSKNIIEYAPQVVGALATIYSVWAALSRKQIALKHELEILKLHRETGLEDADVRAKIQQIKSSAYRAGGFLAYLERAFYIFSGFSCFITATAFCIASYLLFIEGQFFKSVLMAIIAIPDIAFVIISANAFQNSMGRRIGA